MDGSSQQVVLSALQIMYVTDVQYIDFAMSNARFRQRKIHTMPVMADKKGKLAWNNLDHLDVVKTFHYQNVPCLVKGEIHQGRNDCCVWKFCVQLSGGFM